ncbi:MAG TPA: sulfotransferase [Gaiellaceae bacterium]|nr:sulfotransferase [Gaiellaceae bacterium]
MSLAHYVKRPLRAGKRRYFRATSRLRMLPTFIILGAQRAGTSTLFFHLHEHPDVRRPTIGAGGISWSKELHFFDERYGWGLDWYRTFFPYEAARELARRRGHDLQAGEATPYYLFHPAVPARIAETLPDVRLIALLRNPIERAYSHYSLMRLRGRESLSFADAVDAEPERLASIDPAVFDAPVQVPGEDGVRLHEHHRHRSYLSRGLYAEQLERWFEHFPREQLHVIRFEDLAADPARIYRETLEFLGLHAWSPSTFTRRNPGKKPEPLDPAVRARLEEYFAEPNERLAQLLGRDFDWGPRPSAETPPAAREIPTSER